MLTGNECLVGSDCALSDAPVLNFWQWAFSDLRAGIRLNSDREKNLSSVCGYGTGLGCMESRRAHEHPPTQVEQKKNPKSLLTYCICRA